MAVLYDDSTTTYDSEVTKYDGLLTFFTNYVIPKMLKVIDSIKPKMLK